MKQSPLEGQAASSDEELLTIEEVARIFKRTDGAIRTAIWRYRRHAVDPGIPLPILIGGRYRWLSAVAAHLRGIGEKANPHD